MPRTPFLAPPNRVFRPITPTMAGSSGQPNHRAGNAGSPVRWSASSAVLLLMMLWSQMVFGETPDAVRLQFVAADAGVRGSFASHADGIGNSCTTCHRMEPLFSHPVGVRPHMPIPQHLPLQGGLMTCGTCHVADANHRRGSGAMLRSPTTSGLCAECHLKTGDGSATAHAAGLGRAHLESKGWFDRSTSSSPHAVLDSESKSCIGCHDGSAAGDAGAHAAEPAAGSEPSGHPIGVPYQWNARRDGETGLVAPTHLDPRVRLFGRQIGCGSCHSVYSPQRNHLVMSNLQSRLCLSCHIE